MITRIANRDMKLLNNNNNNYIRNYNLKSNNWNLVYTQDLT